MSRYKQHFVNKISYSNFEDIKKDSSDNVLEINDPLPCNSNKSILIRKYSF